MQFSRPTSASTIVRVQRKCLLKSTPALSPARLTLLVLLVLLAGIGAVLRVCSGGDLPTPSRKTWRHSVLAMATPVRWVGDHRQATQQQELSPQPAANPATVDQEPASQEPASQETANQAPGPNGADDRLFWCDFSEAFDVNFDQWPDRWRRQSGYGFPKYNPLKIQPDPQTGQGQVMGMGLDGGQAAIHSDKIPVGQQYSYVLRLRANVLPKPGHECRAWASLNFFDAAGDLVFTFPIKALEASDGWVPLATPLLALEKPSITHATISLHVQPLEETSLFGRAWFDDIELYQMPRIVLETGRPLNVFTDPAEVKLTCQVSGARRTDAGLQIQLLDEAGTVLSEVQQTLVPEDRSRKVMINDDGSFQGFAVKRLVWSLMDQMGKVPGADDPANATEPDYRGFYRLRITLLDRDSHQLVREITFVVLDSQTPGPQTLFGWTLGKSVYQIDHTILTNTLQEAGINWIKLPVWIDTEDFDVLENVGALLQKINRNNIDVIGVLDEPPPAVYKKFWQHEQGMAALTADVRLFQSAIEPVMTQLSLRIGRWQIGSDGDTSVAEDLKNIDKMNQLKAFFTKYGEESKVGLPWTWLLQRVEAEQQAWDFTSTMAYPELSAQEIEAYTHAFRQATAFNPAASQETLRSEAAGSSAVGPLASREILSSTKEEFISLQPLPASEYSLLTRVRDLAARMTEVKRLNIERVFVPEPFRGDDGFFSDYDMPTEILLPWRTLAIHLNGAVYLGQMQLPGRSENHLFAKDGQAMMLIWNDQPSTETLYLGEKLSVINLWGRAVPFGKQENRQVLTVNAWPLLVRGMDLAVAQIRQSIAFDRAAIDSVLGQKQPLKLTFANGFMRGVSGDLTLKNQTLFDGDYTLPFKVARDESFQYTIPVEIRQDSLSGEQLVQLDFHFHNEELEVFSAWHPLRLGLDEIEFATRQTMTPEGHFAIKVTLINRSELPVSYAVYFFVPGRKRASLLFHEVAPGQHSKNMIVYNASGLKGSQLWMRASAAKGARSLNYQLEVK